MDDDHLEGADGASSEEDNNERRAPKGLPWMPDPTFFQNLDVSWLFRSDIYKDAIPSTKPWDTIASSLPKMNYSGYVASLATSSSFSNRMPSLLPSNMAAIEHLIPRSPAAAAIMQNVVTDFFDQQWRSATDPLHSFVTSWFNGLELPDFHRILAALDRQVIPDNLRELGIDEGDLESIAEVLHDGIPLFWVPRARIAARLISAPTGPTRRAIIGHELSAITEDCLEILDLISNSDYLYEIDRLREAADLVFSHPAAVQALATATLDSLMYAIARAKSTVYTLVTGANGRGKAGHEEETRQQLQRDLGKRGSLALAPVRPIYQQFKPRGDKIPRSLNKHASFHRVHPFQYSKRNAAIALMLATSVLFYMSRWFDSELQQTQRQAEDQG